VSFDAYLWQTVENKQKYISQIMSSKSPVRSCDDVDETSLSYAEIKALCAGNPLIKEKMNLDIDVARLRLLKNEHLNLRYRLEDSLLIKLPEKATEVTERIAGIEKDIAMYRERQSKVVDVQTNAAGGAAVSAKFPGMTINNVTYTEKEPAAKALVEACKSVTVKQDAAVGEYMGFHLSIRFDGFAKDFKLLLRGQMTYQIELGADAFGNITRINNALADLPKRLEGAKLQLDDIHNQQIAAQEELDKPFTLETELAEKEARLALVNSDLNLDRGGGDEVYDLENRDGQVDSGDTQDFSDEYDYVPEPVVAYAKAKPSIFDGINRYNSDKYQGNSGGTKTAGLGI
jgi:hypothetical protein